MVKHPLVVSVLIPSEGLRCIYYFNMSVVYLIIETILDFFFV